MEVIYLLKLITNGARFCVVCQQEKLFGRPRARTLGGGGGRRVGRQRLGFSAAHMSQENVLIEKAAGVAGDVKSLPKT